MEIPFHYWTSICLLHAQWRCTGIIFSKSLQNGVAVKHWLSWVTMTHHYSDPSLLLTLTVKGYFPRFPTHYSWVEWPHPTRTLSTAAASCPVHVLCPTPKQNGTPKICRCSLSKKNGKSQKDPKHVSKLHTQHGNRYVFCPYLLIMREIKEVFPALEQVFSLRMQMT